MAGRRRWLSNEFLYHVWHPNQAGCNTDYKGPADGMGMSARALDALARGRIKPRLANPWLRQARGKSVCLERLLAQVAEQEEPAWNAETPPLDSDDVYWVNRDHHGFNIFIHAGVWYALKPGDGILNPQWARQGKYRDLLWAETREGLLGQVATAAFHSAAHEPQSCMFCRMKRMLNAQPLRLLPGKIWRKTRQMIASCSAQPPW